MRALVWHCGAFNDGNGCGGTTQAQRFPMHALKLLLLLMEYGGGEICNVMAGGGEVHLIKILSENFENPKNFEINFGRFREVLRTFLKSILENFDN